MLRPGTLLALSPTSTFVDSLLRTDFAIHKNPSYAGAWPLPRPDFHRIEDACLAGHAKNKKFVYDIITDKLRSFFISSMSQWGDVNIPPILSKFTN